MVRLIKINPNYMVTSDGKVRSRKYNKYLKPYLSGSGHQRVRLSDHGKSKNYYIHHLVLRAFVGPCPEGMECRHLDGNPQNNNLNNLMWGTCKENRADAMEHGTARYAQNGEQNYMAKLNVELVKAFYYYDTWRSLWRLPQHYW